MKLKIIGSGNARSKEICASTLIDNTILVDAGHGVYKKLLQENVDIKSLEAIFITHLHTDHFIDLTAIVAHRNILKDDDPDTPTLHIYLPVGGIEALRVIALNTLDQNIDPDSWMRFSSEIKEYNNHPIHFKDYGIKALKVDHAAMVPSYGLIFKTKDHTVGFSGDSKTCPNIKKIIEASDTLVIDTSYLTECIFHMGLDTVINFAEKYPGKLFLGTHISNEVRNSKHELPKNLHLLRDGEIY